MTRNLSRGQLANALRISSEKSSVEEMKEMMLYLLYEKDGESFLTLRQLQDFTRWKRGIEMKQTQKRLQEEFAKFEEYIQNLEIFVGSDLRNYVCHLVDRRMKGISVRAYYIEKMYAYIKVCAKKEGLTIEEEAELDTLFQRQMPLILELVMTTQYQHNHILDGKFGVVNDEKINRSLIAGNILKDLLYRYINDYLPEREATKIQHIVIKIFSYVDVGQYVDKRFNNYDFFQQSKNKEYCTNNEIVQYFDLSCLQKSIAQIKKEMPEIEDFIEVYFRRIFLTNAALFEMSAQLALDLTGYNGKERENIRQFARGYGILLQIVNDNSDYMLDNTSAKKEEDIFSDIKNKNITLPLMYFLQNVSEDTQPRILKYLQKGDIQLLQGFTQQIQAEIKADLNKSIEKGRYMKEEILQYLDNENEIAPIFHDMLGIAGWNRFYEQLFKS